MLPGTVQADKDSSRQRGKTGVNKSEGNEKPVKVTRPSYFVAVPSYFEALWYPHLYFNRKSNI